MAAKESYLRMLPTGTREPLRKLFNSGAELNNRINLSKAETTGLTMSGAMTTGILMSGATTTGISLTGAATTGINFAGTYSGNGIDFSSCTYTPTGSNGPCLIRAGSYGTPLAMTSEAQSGLIRLYMENTAAGTSYDRGIFVCLKTQNVKGIFPIAGLAEVKNCASTAGPNKVQAAQFICHLNDAGAKLAALGGDPTAGMYAGWFKIGAIDGATTASGSRAAPLWVDNELYGGSNINAEMEEYGIFMTAGGTVPKAVIGFETNQYAAGWASLFYFDETCYNKPPVSAAAPETSEKDADGSLLLNLNETIYYIPYYGANKLVT